MCRNFNVVDIYWEILLLSKLCWTIVYHEEGDLSSVHCVSSRLKLLRQVCAMRQNWHYFMARNCYLVSEKLQTDFERKSRFIQRRSSFKYIYIYIYIYIGCGRKTWRFSNWNNTMQLLMLGVPKKIYPLPLLALDTHWPLFLFLLNVLSEMHYLNSENICHIQKIFKKFYIS